MLTRIAMAALAVTLLGASAFALAPVASETQPPSGSTVIEKNSAWPLKGLITMDPCTVRMCLEA